MLTKATYRTSPNIGLVKYWGKYDEEYILPINDSIGITLSEVDLYTITTVKISDEFSTDQLILNDKNYPISKRIEKMLQIVKQRAKKKLEQAGYHNPHFKILSNNSFPTASGMASSASGLSCLALCLNQLFDNIFTQDQVCQFARLGSGSACRSLFGGLVRWYGLTSQQLKNKKPNNKINQQELDILSKRCISKQILPAQKLKNFNVLILLNNKNEKQVSSTNGMKLSVETSELIAYRNQIANRRIQQLIEALQQKQYSKFSQLIIKDSNQFHAICLDTYPPIFYLNQFSKSIIQIVDGHLNKILPIKIAYTFDAGPHAFLIIENSVLDTVFNYFMKLYNPSDTILNQRARNYRTKLSQLEIKSNQQKNISNESILMPSNIWLTEVGHGPLPATQYVNSIDMIKSINMDD